ncbi:MAG: hypothetical protein ACOC2C_07710, partial [Cyclonatronaceae bacterium]
EWESHLDQAQEKSEQLRDYLNRTLGEEGPRWIKILQEAESEDAALDAFIEEQLMFEEAYLPDDDDWDDDDDLDDDDLFIGFGPQQQGGADSSEDPFADESDNASQDLPGLPGREVFSDRRLSFGFLDDDDENENIAGDEFDFEDDDLSDPFGDELDELDDDDDDFFEEGEEWKLLCDDYSMSDYGSIEHLPVYQKAHRFGAAVLYRSAQTRLEEMPAEAQEAFNQFVSDVLTVNSKVVAGYALGFEADVLGGNIAFCKKGLAAANRALDTLAALRELEVFGAIEFRQLHTDLFEVRNDLGIYIQDLREQFVF